MVDLKATSGYWELKEAALDGTVWATDPSDNGTNNYTENL